MRSISEIKNFVAETKPSLVSMDVFDTLLIRPTSRPRDLHYLYDDEYAQHLDGHPLVSFTRARFQCEDRLRKRLLESGIEEVTHDQIYSEIGRQYGLDADTLIRLRQLEVNIELSQLRPRPVGVELLQAIVQCGVRVVLLSDMYLPSAVVIKALEQNGVGGWESLYVSSDYGFQKRNGRLFEHVLHELGVDSATALHIGDNVVSDGEGAQAAGVAHIILPKPTSNMMRVVGNRRPEFRFGNDSDLGFRTAMAQVAHLHYDDPYDEPIARSLFQGNAYLLGLQVFGPLLFFLCRWILNECRRAKTETLYLLSRDGWMPQRVMKRMAYAYPDMPALRYIASSRNVYLPFTLTSTAKLAWTSHYVGIKKESITVGSLLEKRFGLSLSDEVVAELRRLGITDADAFLEDVLIDLPALTQRLAPLIVETNLEKAHLATEYYDSNILTSENDAFFDIGWRGSSQVFLSQIVGRPLDFYYLACKSEAAARTFSKDSGLINPYFGFSNAVFTPFNSYPIFFESFFANPRVGTCIGFERNAGTIVPVTTAGSMNDRAIAFVEETQTGAMAFVDAVCSTWESKIHDLHCIPRHLEAMCLDIIQRPFPVDAKAISAVESENILLVDRTLNIFEGWEEGWSAATSRESKNPLLGLASTLLVNLRKTVGQHVRSEHPELWERALLPVWKHCKQRLTGVPTRRYKA